MVREEKRDKGCKEIMAGEKGDWMTLRNIPTNIWVLPRVDKNSDDGNRLWCRQLSNIDTKQILMKYINQPFQIRSKRL